MLFAVLSHEAAHLFVMAILGIKVTGFKLGTFGIGIGANYGLSSYLKQAAVSASGSIVNLAIACAFAKATELSAACFAYGVFNLIPLSMLDGGELLELFLLASGVPCKIRARVHTAIDLFLTLLIWTFAVYLAINGTGEGLLISAVYMVTAKLCAPNS